MQMNIKIKRVYEKPAVEDGIRILVDRLWPRGLTKEKASVDFWLKNIAPSTTLRKWFDHDPDKWNEFKTRYSKELEQNEGHVLFLKEQAQNATITLLYGAKDEEHNEARFLKDAFTDGSLK
jgi:uncharacterized protein YeaO (DUF488 family)